MNTEMLNETLLTIINRNQNEKYLRLLIETAALLEKKTARGATNTPDGTVTKGDH